MNYLLGEVFETVFFILWKQDPSAGASLVKKTLGLYLSVDIMVFDFLHFVFLQVQYIHYCWKH